ncbi:hypothetical protein [Magnetofaba australis]|uniref:hypothetical protein n=1 Tax=Magnetofaba australis TaxID=1472297 RepID=UPI000A19D9FF|nr:hypothetical protein [Magnetofaba australis]
MRMIITGVIFFLAITFAAAALMGDQAFEIARNLVSHINPMSALYALIAILLAGWGVSRLKRDK